MKYLITGAAGFIGSHFVDYLLDHRSDAEIIIYDKVTYAGMLDNLHSALDDDRTIFIRGNVCDAELVASACADVDIIIHFAAETHVDRSIMSGQAAAKTNFMGTYTLLEAARHADIERFMYVSTDEVYGPVVDTIPDENSRLNPSNPYSAAKAGADAMVRAFSNTYDLPIIITRPANTYGPRQFPEKLIPLCINKALKGQQLPIYGDGQQLRRWLYVRDHCVAIYTLLLERATGIFNIGPHHTKEQMPNINVVCTLLNRLGFDVPYELIEFVDDRPGHDRRYDMDTTKIHDIGWEATTSLVSGISKTVAWYINHEDWLDKAMQRSKDFHDKWYKSDG